MRLLIIEDEPDLLSSLAEALRVGGNAVTRGWTIQEISTTGFPSTSIFGVMPRPGDFDAAMRPFTRCGAPSAVLTVT
jgi:hypothetical protein